MPSRYENIRIRENSEPIYREIFEERNVPFVKQHKTSKMPFMTAKARLKVMSIPHTWTLGDRFYKLSDRYYDDPTYWWVIAWYNQRPLESDVKIGTTIRIPTPLDMVLIYYHDSDSNFRYD